MAYLIRVVNNKDVPGTTQWDGQYVVHYEPGLGYPGSMILLTSPSLAKGQRFASVADAISETLKVDPDHPWRMDSKPNTPLRRFSIQVTDDTGTPVPSASEETQLESYP